eukprot:9817259-Ditylum_brightwellii.AAC.1
MDADRGWIDTKFENVIFIAPRAPFRCKQVEKGGIVSKYYNIFRHITHKAVGGVTAGQWTVGLPVLLT